LDILGGYRSINNSDHECCELLDSVSDPEKQERKGLNSNGKSEADGNPVIGGKTPLGFTRLKRNLILGESCRWWKVMLVPPGKGIVAES
jgi:hypothetical protein